MVSHKIQEEVEILGYSS